MKQLEKMMKKMTVVLVLVYADWCPHCHTYKSEVWNKLKDMRGKSKVGLAAVNEKVLADSPVKDAKLNGYPSLLLIGEDGRMAEFNDEQTGSPTNALPNARDLGMLSGIMKGPNSNRSDSRNDPMVAETKGTESKGTESKGTESKDNYPKATDSNTNYSEPQNVDELPVSSNLPQADDSPNNVAPNHIEAETSSELMLNDDSPPLTEEAAEKKNASAALLDSLSQPTASPSDALPPTAEEELLLSQEPQKKNSSQLGGSLFMALLEAAKVTAPAAILTAAATAVSRKSRTKKLSRKAKRVNVSRRR